MAHPLLRKTRYTTEDCDWGWHQDGGNSTTAQYRITSRIAYGAGHDAGNYHVEDESRHNDEGEGLLILINHNPGTPRSAPLPEGTRVTIEPRRAHVWTSDRGSL